VKAGLAIGHEPVGVMAELEAGVTGHVVGKTVVAGEDAGTARFATLAQAGLLTLTDFRRR
jgi:threonine dehydrogenase-like Zn-dependent dehydrogenase